MQPEYEKPVMKRPDFAEVYEPCYDYRNMENAGKYRGVGTSGKIGTKMSEAGEPMPEKIQKSYVRRDHE